MSTPSEALHSRIIYISTLKLAITLIKYQILSSAKATLVTVLCCGGSGVSGRIFYQYSSGLERAD